MGLYCSNDFCLKRCMENTNVKKAQQKFFKRYLNTKLRNIIIYYYTFPSTF